MAGPTLKFNFKDLGDLNEDIKKSPRSLPIIAQRVMSPRLVKIARELRSSIPRQTGQLARSLFSSVRRPGGLSVLGTLAFRTRGLSGRTLVAGNVLQKGGAQARKRQYLWIPTRANRNVTPQEFFNSENTFIANSKSGKTFAWIRQGNIAVPMFLLARFVKFAAPPLPINARVEADLPEMLEDIEESIGQVIAARRAALGALTSE